SDRPAPGNALLGGRPGETWSAEPAADRLRVVRD
ncbi:lyase, partial [Pseudomonas aeruginosa]|nr:lyase [Pseudomonas aeruginosa]